VFTILALCVPAAHPPASCEEIGQEIQPHLIHSQNPINQGADYGAPARNLIEDKLRSGMTLAAIEEELQAPKGPQPKREETRKAQPAAGAVPPPPPPAPRKADMGQSLGPAARNPLQLIKAGYLRLMCKTRPCTG
jgi:hypothetical protein